MIERIPSRLRAMVDAVRLVECEPRTCERMWRCYQDAFVPDEDLLRAVGSRGEWPRAINGVTEPLTVAHFEQALSMPQTVGLELVDSTDSDALRGFAIFRYATREDWSRRAFRDFVLGDALCHQEPHFENRRIAAKFNDALSAGNALCSVELVASGSSTVAACLLIAVYRHVVVGRLKSDNAAVVGKCLDGVRIGECINEQGNVGIIALAAGLSLERVGTIDQTRLLAAQATGPVGRAARRRD